MNPIYLLGTEWKKFRKNSVITLLGLMFLLTMPSVIFVGKEWKNLPEMLPSNKIFFEFPTMWDYLGYSGSWLVFFFLGLIVIFSITSEVGYKTMRQNILAGYTRQTFFLSKLYTVLILCLAATLLYTIVGLAIGFYHTEDVTLAKAFDNDGAILRFLLMSLGYCSLGFLISFLLRKSGVSVLFYICYVMLIEHFIKWVAHFRIMQNSTVNYYPSNAFEDLMPNPLYKFADMIPRKDIDFDFLLSYNQAGITSVIYIIVFIGISYWSFIKKDI